MQPLVGCDFSSRPSRRKPIVLAHGFWASEDVVGLDRLEQLHTLEDYARWAAQPGAWIGGFDMPFGLPRALVVALNWPLHWEAYLRHYASLDRVAIREHFRAFCAARPVGSKFAHRATDGPAGSSPSMKWVNPPVAFMLHAGVLPLLDGGAHLPGLLPVARVEDVTRIALEAYPGLLAREVLGRASYKSDTPGKQTPERRACRAALVVALEEGRTRLGLRLRVNDELRRRLLDDASGDSLDAALCLLQVAWGARIGPPWYGLPPELDPLEGWIVSAGALAALASPGSPRGCSDSGGGPANDWPRGAQAAC